MIEYGLFLVFAYLAIGFGLITLQNNGLTVNQSVKLGVMWLPLLLVYLAFLRRK